MTGLKGFISGTGVQPVRIKAAGETPALLTFSSFMGGPKAHEELLPDFRQSTFGQKLKADC
jgi:hypothetical protein